MSMLPNPTCTLTSSRTSEAAEICTDPYPTRIRPSTGCWTSSSWRWMSPPATSTSAGGGSGFSPAVTYVVDWRLPRRLTSRSSMAAPATLTPASSAAGTTSHRARPAKVPTSRPRPQTSAARPNEILIPSAEPWAMSVPTAATRSASPSVAPAERRRRGRRARCGRRRRGSAMAASAMKTDAPSSVVRGDHSATATPSRRRATPMGPSGTVQSPSETATSSQTGTMARPTMRRTRRGAGPAGPAGSRR